METKNLIDYKALCERVMEAHEDELNPLMLVYTGGKEDERPVFRVVVLIDCCKLRFGSGSKEFWGLVGLDPETGESQWYNYNDCVSCEGWKVLDGFLKRRFGWMHQIDPGLAYEVKLQAKAQLREAIERDRVNINRKS